ncbi:unnamed protein product [Clonostachys byssicola]|uniref:Uncharacterized protein n=1 Tax=Clonostachys byssicola TaxID=160290 RepID=A0A9N9XZE3_9HYPO|nr:unnamed protein product [Clonostachys byssicola]
MVGIKQLGIIAAFLASSQVLANPVDSSEDLDARDFDDEAVEHLAVRSLGLLAPLVLTRGGEKVDEIYLNAAMIRITRVLSPLSLGLLVLLVLMRGGEKVDVIYLNGDMIRTTPA